MSYTADSRLIEYETATACKAVVQQHVVAKHSALSRLRVLFSEHFCSSDVPGKGVFSLIYCSDISFDLQSSCCFVCPCLMVDTKRESKFNILRLPHSQASRIHCSADEKLPQRLQYLTANVQNEIGYLPA